MQKRAGWRLLGVLVLLVLTGFTALMAPAREVAAENCCSCHNPWCYTDCHNQCGSDEACLHSCIDVCEEWESYCIDNCPFPIC